MSVRLVLSSYWVGGLKQDMMMTDERSRDHGVDANQHFGQTRHTK